MRLDHLLLGSGPSACAQQCASRHGPVNSSRAVTRHREPRRLASKSRRVPGCNVARSIERKHGGKAGQQAVGICRKLNVRHERGAPGARGYCAASRMSLHASAVKGTGCAGPTRAFSSVGESARLITVRSVVRIHKGPRSYPFGDVAQLEEHLLCKQGVAGSSPAISTGNDPSARQPAPRSVVCTLTRE